MRLSKLQERFTRRPDNISLGHYRYYLLNKLVHPFALCCHTFWLILFYTYGVKEMWEFNIFSVCLFSFTIYLNSRGYFMLITTLGMIEVIAHQLLCVYYIGIDSGFHYYIFIISMLPFVMPTGNMLLKVVLLSGVLFGFLYAEYFMRDMMPIYHLPGGIIRFFGITNISFSFLFLSIWGAYFDIGMRRTERKLKQQHDMSETLLLNILPHSTAEELKTYGSTKAVSYEMATVMFTDFKNFSHVAEQLPPQVLVDVIHFRYSEFDKIISKYGLEKIKTIGDSYMCAGGIPVANTSNAEDAVRAAIEIRDFIKQERAISNEGRDTYLDIRIGIHTGPVVAGVVGIKKFAYDIWGDTVNIASRMESSGEEGKINISGATYELVKDKFACTHRGKINAKHKGEIDMYFVEEKV